jgi:hypothetical protein
MHWRKPMSRPSTFALCYRVNSMETCSCGRGAAGTCVMGHELLCPDCAVTGAKYSDFDPRARRINADRNGLSPAATEWFDALVGSIREQWLCEACYRQLVSEAIALAPTRVRLPSQSDPIERALALADPELRVHWEREVIDLAIRDAIDEARGTVALSRRGAFRSEVESEISDSLRPR